MSNFPISFDDDATLPVVNNNLTEIGGDAINAVRDAVFNIEQYLGLGADGSTGSVADRLGISLNPDGTIKPSALSSLGLVTLPITNSQIAPNAEIPESKLKLDHRTQDLFNYITDLAANTNTSLGWIATSGSKLEPHLLGLLYRHTLDQVDVTNNPALLLKNRFRTFRDNSNAFTVIDDMNNELLEHQFADGSPTVPATLITTNDGSTYPATHAHPASGIFLNTDRFSVVPQTATDLQQFADYVDSSSIFLLGSRIQNLFSNGISRASRSSVLTQDGYGQAIVPTTMVTAYLFNGGASLSPVDNINTGDDIVEFKPTSSEVSSSSFDAKFALVKAGDILRINYGTVEIPFIIKEKKYIQSGGNKKYLVRINGRNFKYTTDGYARIDKPLFNLNKYGALSLSAANNSFNAIPSLIITNPTGAMALGVNFNPDLFDSSHYLLYLALYPNGNPDDGYTILPAIDVTGNAGATPGRYNLGSIVEATNNAFRQAGFNYRFVAFEYQGEFGIALADPYNNASFSILSGVVDSNGLYDSAASALAFPNNVVGSFSTPSFEPVDPLGFGPEGASIASPPYLKQYASAEASQLPTKLFVPLKRNNYYVNGIERDKFALEPEQVLDVYGDGYWAANIISRVVIPIPGSVETTYRIPYDLDNSSLSIGKTIVVQSLGEGGLVDFGRFIIKSLNISCAPGNSYTDITVYDAIHATGISPASSLDGYSVAIYFNSDSVTFNAESATDFNNYGPFKRHFEIYVDQDGKTFSHERGRINISGTTFNINEGVPLHTYSELAKLNIIKISPKLRGYQFGTVNKITLHIDSLGTNGVFSGYLCYFDGSSYTKKGPTTTGYLGQVTRFYDETNVDYIDLVFDVNTTTSAFNNQDIDFQLFPTLSLDQEIMLLGTCQVNDTTKVVNYLRDERQFGNTSEKDLTTSALNYISLGEKYLNSNGVIRGFDLQTDSTNPYNQQIYLKGGLALVNGKFISINDQTVVIPVVKEGVPSNDYNINWALCVNDRGEYQPIPLLDYDPVLGTPNNPNRIFTLYNPSNALTYNVEAVTFSNLINNRKDLTILYIVASTVVVSPSVTITLQISDARKYVNDVDSNLSLKLTSGNAQGNFKNASSILEWIKYNNSFNGVAVVKGAVASTTGLITNPYTFSFSSNVTIDGLSNAALRFDAPVSLGSNITFRNLSLTFNNIISVVGSSSNIRFENCNITVNLPSTPSNNILFDFNNCSNVVFENCTFSVTYTVQATSGAVFRITNTNKFSFNNSTLTVSFNIGSSTTIVPGDVFILKISPDVRVTNSNFFGNFSQFVRNTNSNGLYLDNLTVRSSYNPSVPGNNIFNAVSDPLGIADGLPVVTYSPTNLINNGRGYIYSLVSARLTDITIKNVNFEYNPLVASNNRFSFINFELSTTNSLLDNVTISNCRFTNSDVGGSIDDVRAAISIINTSRPVGSSLSVPTVSNLQITNNICNRNQLIALTSQTDSGIMKFAGLFTKNCLIQNNNCGTIGYWVGSSTDVYSLAPSVNNYNDKESGLVINNNTCHLINNIDHTGAYFLAAKLIGGTTTNMCEYPSGVVTISNNKCNWIHVAISYEEKSYLQIVDNYLSGYDVTYLSYYGDTQANSIANGTFFSPGYAIFVNSNKHSLVIPPAGSPGDGKNSSCLIRGNSTSTGYWLNTAAPPVSYGYYRGYIFCQSSSIISHNILKGVTLFTGGGITGVLILVSGNNNIITNNQIFRNGVSVVYYIDFFSFENPAWTASETYGIIVDNTFDSPYSNTSTLNENLIAVIDNNVKNWTIERNKNQTGYALVPLTNGMIPFGADFSFTPNGYVDFGTSDYWINVVPTSNYTYKSYVLRIHNEAAPPTSNRIGWQEDLSKFVPSNVKIMGLKFGARAFGSAVSPGTFIRMDLNKYNTSANAADLDYFTAPAPPAPPFAPGISDSNVVNDSSSPFFSISGINLNSTPSTDTVFADIDLTNVDATTGAPGGGSDVTNNYILGQGYNLSVSVNANIARVIGNPDLDLYLSPIVVKYRW